MLRLLRHIALAFFKAVVHALVISWQAVYNLTYEVWHQIILLHFLKMWNAWTWRHTLIYITSLTTYNQHCFLGFVWTEFGKPANLVDFGFSRQASSMVLNLLPRNWIPSSASGRREDDKPPKGLMFDGRLLLLLLLLCQDTCTLPSWVWYSLHRTYLLLHFGSRSKRVHQGRE